MKRMIVIIIVSFGIGIYLNQRGRKPKLKWSPAAGCDVGTDGQPAFNPSSAEWMEPTIPKLRG